jgi:hypothetical protein
LLHLSGIETQFYAQGVNERGNGRLLLAVSTFCLINNIFRLQLVSESALKMCVTHTSFVLCISNIMSS